MDRFEYCIIEVGKEGMLKTAPSLPSLSDHLNHLGQQGWEMAGCFSTSWWEGETRSAVAIMKRRIPG